MPNIAALLCAVAMIGNAQVMGSKSVTRLETRKAQIVCKKLYYYPFFLDADPALRPAQLATPLYDVTVKARQALPKIARLLLSAKPTGRFSPYATRLIVVTSDGTRYLVDRDGNISSSTGTKHLAKAQLSRLKSYLDARWSVPDLPPGVDWGA
jgi:hypothetical protein